MQAQLAFDKKTAQLVPPTAEELLEADKSTIILGYVDGMSDGQPFWAYVAIKPSKYAEFHAKTSARQHLIIEDYGTIIASGYDLAPPAEVVQEMKEKYGADARLGEALKQEAIRQQKAFVDK